ncbi:M4 family metallopeptidase [Nocardioides dilutus]
MRVLKSAICLVMLGAGITAVPPQLAGAAAPAAAADKSLIQQIKDGADGTVTTTTETATGKVGFITTRGADADLLPGRSADSAASAAAKADAFLDRYARAFGARPGELVRQQVSADKLGWTVDYVQRYRGVPVFAAMLRAHVDRDGNLTAVNGYAAPNLDLSVSPRLSPAAVGRAAVAAVKADPPGHDGDADVSGIKAVQTDLVVYRHGVPRGDRGKAVLAYVVEVSNRANVRDMVFLDANTGKLVNRYSLVHDALDRELYEISPATTPVWAEGDAFPGTLNQGQQDLVEGTGESYWLFMNSFGRDSYDGAGATMKTVNNDPNIDCPNANWNGVTTNYCDGVTSDDVVAHEWGHAYTEHTWDGIYQWQPGALNESYSDIWGETVDLINGRQDADEGNIDTPRTVGQCSTHSPATPVVVINSPAEIAKDCEAGAAQFGAQLDGTGITGNVVLGIDTGGASTTDACEPLTNGAEVDGNIALVDRGTCAFTIKVKNAQDAGAVAVLVADNVEAPPSPMSGTDATITIPSVRIRLSDGNLIKSELSPGPVNVTMKDAAGTRQDSYRWLMGEDSTAFGGAIRDMWHPNCYGDPGKVSDAQYYCATDDGGGVHSNSGVPNHGYSLLVDGGTFNGQTVAGIGLTKAAHIYWRAQSVYQTPTTDFVDHANALETSCTDLVGDVVNGLSTAGSPEDTDAPAPLPDETIEAADCAEVTKMIAAVELRMEPTQCNFQPLLKPGGPSLCGTGFSTNTVFKEDFEDGLAGWGTDVQYANPGNNSLPWVADSTAPGGHAGGTARGVGTGEGDCSGGVTDYSSRDSITSPVVAMPATLTTPMLTFEHYVATEAGYDGGNVKISINGGAFTLIPTAAYVFNQPNATMAAAPGNTSPLAGQPGFTGTDGGSVTSTWGTSFVDLAAAGVKGGDQVRFRFDYGRDGCGGLDGWYVDNVTVSNCVAPPAGKVDSTTKLRIRPKHLEFKEDFKAKIRVKAEGGVVPTGKVKLLANGERIGKGTLNAKGRLVLIIKRNLPPGLYKMVAKYLGSATVKKSSDKVMVTITP